MFWKKDTPPSYGRSRTFFTELTAAIIIVVRKNPDYYNCYNNPYPDVGTPYTGITYTLIAARIATTVGIVKHSYTPPKLTTTVGFDAFVFATTLVVIIHKKKNNENDKP